jgi:Carboxypeptidase regulatory-like domain
VSPTPPLHERHRLRLPVGIPQIVIAIVCLMLFVPRAAFAQANAGLTGTVTDTSGAVVPAANVTITNQDTSISTHVVTGSAGQYAVSGLNPGRYSVTVEGAGFKKAVQKDVNVEVSVTATIDITLSAGSVGETVEVTASQIALNTTQPQLGSTIEPEVVAALPSEVAGRGRQIDALQFLAPGTTGSTFSHRIGGGVDFEQEIVYNGIPVPQPETEGYTTNFDPPFEMVQEFRVERSTFAAQFGLGLGALTYQMASGSNHYHGDLFEINRNSLFDSVGFFNGPAWNTSNPKNKPPSDHENNYGFTVGGPISIPHLYKGRDRTFGHYSQEWYKQNNEDTDSSTVPTAAMKTGDFTNFVDGNGNQIPIFDPTQPAGTQFECNGVKNVICPDRISANAKVLIPDIPDPDRTGSGGGGLDSNKSFAPFINPHIQHNWGFTVDQNLTPTQSVHYSQWRNSFSNYSFDNSPLVIQPNPLNSMKFEPALGSGFLLSYNNAISAHLAMTAGFGWIGEINNQFNQTNYQFPAIEDGLVPPNITFDGQHTLTSWGTSGAWLQSINRKLGIAIVNNWLWTKSRHTFNIGGEFRRAYQDDNEEQTAGGQFNFSQKQTSNPADTVNFGTYGSSFASFLLGLPDSVNRSNSQELRLRNLDLSPYVQDDIKMSPRLTVNLGLRWDMQFPFTENNNLIVFFDPTRKDPLADNIAGGANKFGNCSTCAGYTHGDIHFTHFGPRFGFAYKLSDKMVVQAGFAVAFLNGGAYEYGTNKVAVNDSNLLTGSFVRLKTGTNTSSFGSWDTNTLLNPQATAFTPGLGGGLQIEAFDKKKDGYAPYAQQWNANLQRELPYNMFMTVAWLGNRVVHLPSKLNVINQLNPSFLTLGSQQSTCLPAGTSVLSDTFGAGGCAAAEGFVQPYTNFVQDFGGAATVAQSLQPYPQYANIFNNFEGSGTTYYQSAQLELEKRFTNGLAFLAGYTLSHQMDNTNSGFSSFANGGINKYNQKPEWAVSSNNPEQTLKVSGTYELPIGPNKKFFSNHGVTGQVLGGWQVAWVLDYEEGTPFGVGENGTPFPNGFDRPNRVPGVSISSSSYSNAKKQFLTKVAHPIFNPAAFALTPSQYVLGDVTRNYGGLKNAPTQFENLNARKKFFFGERFTGILAVDYFNAFNRTQFNGPDTTANDSTFGQVTSQGTPGNYPANRQGQVTFRLEF